jgi:membrane protein required for colicin V production
MPLTLLDGIVIIVILISAMLAMARGFVREVLAVASWVAAAAAAFFFHAPLVPLIAPYIESTTVATIIAAAVVFFVALIVTSYITMKIADFVIDSRIGLFDRLLGFVFGAVRGLLLLVIIFQFFGWLVPNPPDWVAQARSRPILEDLGTRLIAAMPSDIEETINRWRHGDEPEVAPPDGALGTPDEDVAPADGPPATDAPAEGEDGYDAGDRQGLDQLIEGGATPNQ